MDMRRFFNILLIPIVAAFLVFPVAFFSAYPEAVPQFFGKLLADYCFATGQCDYRFLMAGLGVGLFILITIGMALVESVSDTWDDDNELDINTILSYVKDIHLWMEDVPMVEEKEINKPTTPKGGLRDLVNFTLVVLAIILAWGSYCAGSRTFGNWGVGGLSLSADNANNMMNAVNSPVLSYTFGFLSFVCAGLIVYNVVYGEMIKPESDLFWEKNWLVRKMNEINNNTPSLEEANALFSNLPEDYQKQTLDFMEHLYRRHQREADQT